MTQTELLRALTASLQAAGVPDASFDAKQLLHTVLNQDESVFLLQRGRAVAQSAADAAFALAARRINGEPLQYLLGVWSFLDEEFSVGPGVLIPRPETEELVLRCETLLRQTRSPVILDLCAGSGCIGLSLQKRIPDAHVVLVEASDDALCYLNMNAQKLNVADRVRVIRADVLRGPDGIDNLPMADLIVSNPPYIPGGALAGLQREVQREPAMALDGGEDGLRFYRCFSFRWRSRLKPDGRFAFECGEGQSAEVAAMFEPFGFHVEIGFDFNGFDRFVFAFQCRKDPFHDI